MYCQSIDASIGAKGGVAAGCREQRGRRSARHGQIEGTSFPTGYANEFFGRGTLSRKSPTSRAGAFARMMFTNSSFDFMYRSAAFTHASVAASPLRTPIPHGMFRNLSVVSFSVGSCV